MGAEQKIRRVRQALAHQESDRVPVSEFFWTGFVERCRAKWGADFDPYRFFDLDYVVVGPNMDPRIQAFEVLEETDDDVVVKTGFGATIRRSGKLPMPSFEAFDVQRPEQLADVVFEDPRDPRRFFMAGDDQLNGVADTLVRNIPSWDERVDSYADEFAVMGALCGPYEYLWRLMGSDKALLWMASDPQPFADFVERVGAFMFALAEAQIEAARGRLCGMYIWGDVAYRNGMFFSPRMWRQLFKPHVRALIELCHANDLVTIYHGCGNAQPIYEDLIEIGLDGYNPVEAKADLDVAELKKSYGGRLAFAGNIDVRILERGDVEEIRNEVRYKLQAAVGGGWIFQSDHSVSSDVAPESYALALKTVRQLGDYPLAL